MGGGAPGGKRPRASPEKVSGGSGRSIRPGSRNGGPTAKAGRCSPCWLPRTRRSRREGPASFEPARVAGVEKPPFGWLESWNSRYFQVTCKNSVQSSHRQESLAVASLPRILVSVTIGHRMFCRTSGISAKSHADMVGACHFDLVASAQNPEIAPPPQWTPARRRQEGPRARDVSTSLHWSRGALSTRHGPGGLLVDKCLDLCQLVQDCPTEMKHLGATISA